MKIFICLQSNFQTFWKSLVKFLHGDSSIEPLYPFLKTGVIFAFFKMDGNVDFLKDSLKNLQI